MRTFIVACLACVPMVSPQHRALAEDKKSDEAGPTFASDVVAKHFSFIVGAVVLSPFKLSAVDTDANPVTTELRLETGNTDARGLIEAGFRRRWAWEEWEPEDFRDTTCAARKNRDEARRQLALLTSEPKTEWDIAEITKYQEQLATAEQEIATARRFDLSKSADVFLASKETSSDMPWKGAYFLPDNYVVRLGFALGADKASGAASIAGAGDFIWRRGLDSISFVCCTEAGNHLSKCHSAWNC